MDNGSGLDKKYGLLTAIAMVVGIVIGSGVFFKAEKILVATGGDLPMGILAWVVGGAIMVACAYSFALMATKYEYVNGIVDYAEVTTGKKYGYAFGWFLTFIYYPTITSVLAWVSARYTLVLLGVPDITGGECMALAGLYMVASYALNSLSPVLSGKFQVSTTVIKLIPLLLMAVIGTIRGISTGLLVENFTTVATTVTHGNPFFAAVVASAFAYEGWIIATSINSELKDAKKNLPIALVLGTLIIVAVYVLYYIGLAGAVENSVMMANGETGARIAFETIFTKVGGSALFVFVIISCLGTLNGLMLGQTRGMYAIAARGEGPKSEMFSQVDKTTNMPNNSAVIGLLVCAFWLTYFHWANLSGAGLLGPFCFDSSELPIVAVYAMYIPIFINFMRISDDPNPLKKYFAPLFASAGCIFMVISAFYAHGVTSVLLFLVVCVIIMAAGALCYKKKK